MSPSGNDPGNPPLSLLVDLPTWLEERFAELKREDADILVLLERAARESAPSSFIANLTFEPFYQNLLELNYENHAWAALLVASAVPELSSPSVQVAADDLLESAWRRLRVCDDTIGQGYANFVRGKRALYRGRLDEAAAFWRLARESLGEASPVQEMNSAYLAFEAFQAGDLRGGQKIAEEALELAKLRKTLRPQAFARLLLAFLALYEGSFSQAEAELVAADATYHRITDPTERFEHPLVQTAFGALYAFRGDYREAERYFADALALTELIPLTQRYVAITLAVRAELTAGVHPDRATDDAAKARSFWPAEVGGLWRAWALRAGGVAARIRRSLDESQKLLTQACDESPNALELGRSRLELGKTLVERAKAAGDGPEARSRLAEAAEALLQAKEIFERSNARFWLTQTYLVLAETDPQTFAFWQGQARTRSDEDPAYRRLFKSEGQRLLGPEQQLRIRLHGEPGVFIGDVPVSFATKQAELLVYALAVTHDGVAGREELTERLWPQSPTSQKLRTALWQAKVALGAEGWRLHRDADKVVLQLRGVFVDDRVARAEVERVVALGALVFTGSEDLDKNMSSQTRARELRERRLDEAASRAKPAMATLETVLLGPWIKDASWVAEEHQERLQLVAQCRRVLAEIASTLVDADLLPTK